MTQQHSVDEFTELVDGSFARVDLVGKAANGIHRFLIAKSADDNDPQRGMMEASVIRDLVAKASEKENPVTEVAKAEDLLVGDDGGTPGSAEWEQTDADTASKWTGLLARAMSAVELLRDREMTELIAGVEGAGDTWDLDEACCAIQAAIDCLAPFAVGEAAEAELQADIAKAAFALEQDPFPLTTIEALSAVKKAGRVLSTVNEGRIRDAATALEQVLSSLPAPEGAVMKSTEDVTKGDGPVAGTTQADTTTGQETPNGNSEQVPNNAQTKPDDSSMAQPGDVKTLAGQASSADDIKGSTTDATSPVGGTTQADMVGGNTGQAAPNANPQQVNKAAGEEDVTKAAPQQAVYNSAGKLLGTVDPSKITELVDEGSTDAATTPEDPEAAAGADDTTSEGDTTPPADMAPADAGAVGTPASDDVTKSDVAEVVKAALTEITEQHAVVVKALEDRIATLEAPAKSRVLSNGALPPTNMLRGMDQGANQVDVAKAEELREQLDSAPDAPSRMAIEKEMDQNAAAAYALLRAGQPGGAAV